MYEIRCERCKALIEGEPTTFDLMSLPNGKEIVKKRFGVEASMALVALCVSCYERGMEWIQK